MPKLTNNQFVSCLKSAANIKLSSDSSVLRITYEGLTNFQSFVDFNHNTIESFSESLSNNIDAIFLVSQMG